MALQIIIKPDESAQHDYGLMVVHTYGKNWLLRKQGKYPQGKPVIVDIKHAKPIEDGE